VSDSHEYGGLIDLFIYRIEPKKVIVVQMFHEREDFVMLRKVTTGDQNGTNPEHKTWLEIIKPVNANVRIH
jgi:hypothetical protein